MSDEKSDKKKLTYAELKKRKKPSVKRVPVVFDSEIAEEFNELNLEVTNAKEDMEMNPRNKELRTKYFDLKEKLDALLPKVEEQTVEFVFRSIGRARFDEVMESCPPTDKQLNDAKKKGEDVPLWNGDTFPPALVAACIVEPELTEDEVFEIWEDEDWNHAEVLSLFMAALEVNQSRNIANLGKGFGTTLS